MKQKINITTLGVFFVIAGLNHFVNPSFYIPLIPDYFTEKTTINWISGIAEILLGIGVLWKETRYFAALGIMLMLFAFIPAHIHFIQLGSCIENGLCVPAWVGWLRLVVIHPMLIWWAWSVRK